MAPESLCNQFLSTEIEWIFSRFAGEKGIGEEIVTDYERLHCDIQACRACKSLEAFGYHRFPSNVHGNKNSGVWIVGSDPRAINQEENPRYWTGRSRPNLRDPLEGAFGEALEDLVYLTDLVKCQRPGRQICSEQIKKCPTRFLNRELTILKPHAVIVLGTVAKAFFENDVNGANRAAKSFYLPHPSPANGNAVRQVYHGVW